MTQKITFFNAQINCSSQGAEQRTEKSHYCTQVKVNSKLGVHARVAAKLVKEAQKHTAEVTIRHKDREADAKSILDILFLAAGNGSTLELSATGIDSEKVVNQLVQFLHHA
mgnify:CR=1 FL=1